MPENPCLHPEFRLNGVAYDLNNLLIHADELCQTSDRLQNELGSFLIDWFSDSETIILKTSGSTGRPKEIVAQKSKLVASAQSTIIFCDLKPQQTALLCLPLMYIGGKMMLIRAMLAGLWIDVASPSASPFNAVDSYDFSAITPYQLQHSLTDLHKINLLLVGGAPVSVSLANEVKGSSTQVYETYGMTETFSHVALKNLSLGHSHFIALPNVSFVIDEGCLVIHAPKLSKNPIKSNDRVDLISPIGFVWLGRSDYVINSGGIKLHPEQIEDKLTLLFNRPVLVFGMPDDDLGESLAVVFEGVIPDRCVQVINDSNLFERYQKPKHIFCLPEFVRSNDKLMRRQTFELLRN
jgi:O-succinylbenzoic acid--CoA ligase